MRMSHLASIAFACSISLFSTASIAQPPADDGRCDVLSGYTPGLYGLCVAYWATQENGKSDASSKILEKYNEKRDLENDDPNMPGLCPCWTADELGSWRDSLAEDGVFPECSDPNNDFVVWSYNPGVNVQAVRSSTSGSCAASINEIGINRGPISGLDQTSSGTCHGELVANLCSGGGSM